MFAAVFAVLAFAVIASAIAFVVRLIDYLRTERIIERRLDILSRSEV